MSYSLHVNILLYSSDTSSPFHAQAQSFLQSCMNRRDLFYLIWPTIMGYLRIVTHPSIFDEPLTPEEAMANVETLLNLPHCRCLAEEARLLGDLEHRCERDSRARKPGTRCSSRSTAPLPRRAQAVHQ